MNALLLTPADVNKILVVLPVRFLARQINGESIAKKNANVPMEPYATLLMAVVFANLGGEVVIALKNVR